MYTNARWHSEGLRWIGTLFLDAADYLERAGSDDAPPYEPLPPQLARGDDYLEDVRSRIHSRYF
jgi:hypothetical protein